MEAIIYTGPEAERILDEIFKSGHVSLAANGSQFPAHSGARGWYFDTSSGHFVAFDNSTNDCFVEDFKFRWNAESWLKGYLSADEAHDWDNPTYSDSKEIILSPSSFEFLMKDKFVKDLPPMVKFDEHGEYFVEMIFHDGFAYDCNVGFDDGARIGLYYPTIEEVLRDKDMLTEIQRYTGRSEITSYDIALKYGQASVLSCPLYRSDAAKRAIFERTVDPSARSFTEEQRKAINLAADCEGLLHRPASRSDYFKELFFMSSLEMKNIPEAWKADVQDELESMVRGSVRGFHQSLSR